MILLEIFLKEDRIQKKQKTSKIRWFRFYNFSDGYIVTNNHVVEGATTVKVTLNNDETFVADVIGLDSRMDLALLKIDAKKKLPFITFGDSKKSK